MIPSFNYCFYWFSGTICIPDSISMLTFQPRSPFHYSPNQPSNNVPRLHPIFFIQTCWRLPPLSPPCTQPLCFCYILPDFYHKETPNIPKKGEPMKAVKILVVLCKSDFREKKKRQQRRGWEVGQICLVRMQNKKKIFPLRADISISISVGR